MLSLHILLQALLASRVIASSLPKSIEVSHSNSITRRNETGTSPLSRSHNLTDNIFISTNKIRLHPLPSLRIPRRLRPSRDSLGKSLRNQARALPNRRQHVPRLNRAPDVRISERLNVLQRPPNPHLRDRSPARRPYHPRRSRHSRPD